MDAHEKQLKNYYHHIKLFQKIANDIKHPDQAVSKYLKSVFDNIFTQLEDSCLYMKDKGNQYDNMTHLQLGLIQKTYASLYELLNNNEIPTIIQNNNRYDEIKI